MSIESFEEYFLGKLTTRQRNIYEDVKSFIRTITDHIGNLLRTFTDHGEGHSKRVVVNLHKIISPFDLQNPLNPTEAFILLSSCWLHDLGMMINRYEGASLSVEEVRELHHKISKSFVEEKYDQISTDLKTREALAIARVCYGHSRSVNLKEINAERYVGKEKVRMRFLTALLSLADALDTTEERAPEIADELITKSNEAERHWNICQNITGVGINPKKSTIVVEANWEREPGKIDLKWKLRQLYSELRRAMPTLNSEGIKLSQIELRLHHNSSIEKVVLPEPPPSWGPPKTFTKISTRIDKEGKVKMEIEEHLLSEQVEKIIQSIKGEGLRKYLGKRLFNGMLAKGFKPQEISVREVREDKFVSEFESEIEKKGKEWRFRLLTPFQKGRVGVDIKEKECYVEVEPYRRRAEVVSMTVNLPENAEEIYLDDFGWLRYRLQNE